MSPRSRSLSFSPRRSCSKSPVRRGHRFSHRQYESRSRSYSRRPHTPPMPSGRRCSPQSVDTKSLSRSPTPRYRRRVSRSRSRSHSYSRTHSRRNIRDNPPQSRCIGVFGLSVYTTQQKIREIFSKFGAIEKIQVVIDAKTGRSRGFCFIYYESLTDAKVAKETCSGLEIDDRRIRVDYSFTQRPHAPTPGIYMGRVVRSRAYERDYSDRYREERSYRRRSPISPSGHNYHRTERRRREHSKSRSVSPRRIRVKE